MQITAATKIRNDIWLHEFGYNEYPNPNWHNYVSNRDDLTKFAWYADKWYEKVREVQQLKISIAVNLLRKFGCVIRLSAFADIAKEFWHADQAKSVFFDSLNSRPFPTVLWRDK